jgi:hypothetical protein
MPDFYPVEAPAPTKPVTKAPANAVRSLVRRTVVSYAIAGQAIGDRLLLPRVPKGSRGVRHRLQASIALGGVATLALGVAGNVGKYRAAAILNTTVAEDVSSAVNMSTELAADEDQFLTVAGAALPAGPGILTVEILYNDD